MRSVKKLKTPIGSFTSRRIQLESGVAYGVSNRTLKGKAINFYDPRKILFIECIIVPGLKKT